MTWILVKQAVIELLELTELAQIFMFTGNLVAYIGGQTEIKSGGNYQIPKEGWTYMQCQNLSNMLKALK